MQKHIQQGPHKEGLFSAVHLILVALQKKREKRGQKNRPIALTQKYNGQLPLWLTSLQ